MHLNTYFSYLFFRHNLCASSASPEVAYAFAQDTRPLIDNYGKFTATTTMDNEFHVTYPFSYAASELLLRHGMNFYAFYKTSPNACNYMRMGVMLEE